MAPSPMRTHSFSILPRADDSPYRSGELRKALTYTDLLDDRKEDLQKYYKPEEELKHCSKSVRAFYESQNSVLEMYKEVDAILDETTAFGNGDIESSPLIPKGQTDSGDSDPANKRVKFAILVNLVINVILVIAKIAVALLSNSISLLASTVDSAMDLLSTVIIWTTSKLMSYRGSQTTFNFPTGKRRLEPISIIVFSVFMQASFLQVLIESVQRLFDKHLEAVDLSKAAIAIMWTTIAVKTVVWFWCRSFKNSSIRALAQDAENDVVFNFFSLLFPWVGSILNWKYLDAAGGVLLSLYIITDWASTLIEHTTKICGKRASPHDHSRIIYLVTRFSKVVRSIQHVTVYHQGDDFIVETDIIVPSQTPLPLAHNVGESIQMALGLYLSYSYFTLNMQQKAYKGSNAPTVTS